MGHRLPSRPARAPRDPERQAEGLVKSAVARPIVVATTAPSGFRARSPAGVPYLEAIAAASGALGEPAFEAAWAEGRALTLDEAVALAMQEALP